MSLSHVRSSSCFNDVSPGRFIYVLFLTEDYVVGNQCSESFFDERLDMFELRGYVTTVDTFAFAAAACATKYTRGRRRDDLVVTIMLTQFTGIADCFQHMAPL